MSSMRKTLSKRIPCEIMYSLLDKISSIECNHYIVNMNTYKVLKYRELHTEFLKKLEPYYLKSRSFYVTEKLTYNRFITILKQICACNNISYSHDTRNHNCMENIIYRIRARTSMITAAAEIDHSIVTHDPPPPQLFVKPATPPETDTMDCSSPPSPDNP